MPTNYLQWLHQEAHTPAQSFFGESLHWECRGNLWWHVQSFVEAPILEKVINWSLWLQQKGGQQPSHGNSWHHPHSIEEKWKTADFICWNSITK